MPMEAVCRIAVWRIPLERTLMACSSEICMPWSSFPFIAYEYNIVILCRLIDHAMVRKGFHHTTVNFSLLCQISKNSTHIIVPFRKHQFWVVLFLFWPLAEFFHASASKIKDCISILHVVKPFHEIDLCSLKKQPTLVLHFQKGESP